VSANRLLLILVLVFFPVAGGAVSETPAPVPQDVSAAGETSSWSASLETFAYLLEDDPYVMPILGADRGSLHLEGRYQYEDRSTVSAWAGRNIETGTTLRLEVVPMAGVVAGLTTGFAPGLEATLSWRSIELYSEGEYVFDFEGTDGDYFYHWSQLSWQAQRWLAFGLSAQRTRMYRSEFSIERGVFAAATRGPVQLSVYGFNLDGDEPFAIIALGVDF
jgi:hypothetical protein